MPKRDGGNAADGGDAADETSMVAMRTVKLANQWAMFCDTIQKISEYELITSVGLILYYSSCRVLRKIEME